jgi:hypothetical protein
MGLDFCGGCWWGRREFRFTGAFPVKKRGEGLLWEESVEDLFSVLGVFPKGVLALSPENRL